MPHPDAPRSTHIGLVLLLLLGALIAGASLGHLLLPPGRLGVGAEIGMPQAQVQVAAAEARPSAPAWHETQRRERSAAMERARQAGAFPSPLSLKQPLGHPARKSFVQPTAARSFQGEDRRLEMQVGLTWQYAAGADSRKLRAPDSAPEGAPR